jgi:hypothetical protein
MSDQVASRAAAAQVAASRAVAVFPLKRASRAATSRTAAAVCLAAPREAVARATSR